MVGVTGGVASGKSTVTALFETHGVFVADADVVARSVVAPGQRALREIVARFGAGIILVDGSLDRARMRTLIFNDARARKDLEAITHPMIRAELQRQCAFARSPYAIAAIPLLGETGAVSAYPWLNRILVVDSPVAVQRKRLMVRDGIDYRLADRMIQAQASRKQRLTLATDVIVNDGTVESLVGATNRLHILFDAFAISLA